ncbi:MAG TPA: TonB-dependent receptor [Terracidiphilus sp.]
MPYLRTRSAFTALSLLIAVLITLSATGFSQTFRGGITGVVTDPSGAAVAGAQVIAVETATNTSYKSVSSSAGEFTFANVPLGNYTVTVTASSFKTIKVEKIPVTAGSTYALPVRLPVATAGETVEVTADALALDTVSDQQSAVLPEVVVQNLPNSGRDYTQLIGQTTGFAGAQTGGGGYNFSVNGSRSNAVNWQIEGTDNNDLWWNIPAVNQTGVNGIAGVIFPIDAIENFSIVTAGSTEIGRNPGGTVNLTVKSGSNTLHGTAFYFNHNEAFQATNPFESRKPETRNQHYGFSAGGPILKDKLFYFLAGEHQGFLIGASNAATEPSAAYQTAAYAILDSYGVAHNPVAHNLLYGTGSDSGLWPSSALNGAAQANNYTATGNIIGHSFNGVLKLDGQLTEKDHIALDWFVGQGNQTAPSTSALSTYFEVAPIHVQNYSLVYNRLVSPAISNQLAAGVSYFNQVFSDADTNFNPVGLGLDTGVSDPTLAGAPHLIIGPPSAGSGLFAAGGGFDPLGVTSPSGRQDITGHLDDDLAWTKGAHQLHIGGEFRKAQVNDFYQTGARGTIYFDGSQGPWSKKSVSDPNLLYLADFLAGYFDPNYSNIVLGDSKRLVYVNTFALFAQDAWQISKRLSLNFGLRYDYEGPVHTGQPNLSIFDPTQTSGLAVVGQDVSNIYQKFWGGVSPRVGFAYRLDADGKSVLRGGYGFYGDSVFMKSILQNNGAQNISVFGPEFNPAGSQKVAQAAGLPNTVIANNVPIYQTYAAALAGQGTVAISTFDKNFRPSYTQTYDLNIQHSFGSNVIWQIGYVGTQGIHLLGLFDINPETAGSANLANPNVTRPYYSKFSNFTVIDEARSNLGSNYNSLQTSLRVQNYHGITSQLGYTRAHALDYETGLLPYVPQDPTNERAEYGNSDFDVRNTFSGYIDYQVPAFNGPKRLTHGWDLTSSLAIHGGTPYTVVSASNPSGNGEGADRAVQVVKNPSAGISHSIIPGSSGSAAYVQWFSSTAFVDAASGQYSPTRRGQNYNPGYNSIDLAVVKNTPITERVSAQLRADIINVFNHTNLAPVGFPTAGETSTIGGTIGQYLGNPGIGPGEPVNAQLALKIIF